MPSGKHPIRFKLRTILLLMIPVALFCVVGSVLYERHYDNQPIQWQTYSRASLKKHLENNRAVLVFFTASWDPTAKMVEATALETIPIRRLLRKHRVVPLRADCTDWKIDAQAELPSLKCPPTPVIAIYNAGNSANPAIFGNLISESDLSSAIGNIEMK